MSDERKALDVLLDIDASLKTLVGLMRKSGPKPAAPDSDLDSKWGDPELKFIPRGWTGVPCKGFHFSECPPELLDLVAESLDYFADQAEAKDEKTTSGKPVAPYKRKDAMRARGWAKRLREGWTKRETALPADDFGQPDDPFGGSTF